MDRRSVLKGLATGALIGTNAFTSQASQAHPLASEQEGGSTSLDSSAFHVEIDSHTGAVTSIAHPDDPAMMSWIGGPVNAPWQPAGSMWGLGYADLGSDMLHCGRWSIPASIERDDSGAMIFSYQTGPLKVEVRRRLVGETFEENYRFTNTGDEVIRLRDNGWRNSALSIYTPFNDHYTNTLDVLEHRAHAHIWTGGASSWVALLRMGGRGPHLGLVLTEGAIDGYSVEDRNLITLSNTRGTFLLHPAIEDLAPGESRSIGWTLFWHLGWDDFFAKALRLSPQMVKVDASRWTLTPGETSTLKIAGDLGRSPALSMGEQQLRLRKSGSLWQAEIPAGAPGEQVLTLDYGEGLSTKVVLNMVPDLDELIAARVRFITERQQWHKPGDTWDGAYIVYDNDLDTMVRNDPDHDRNCARERVAMGILVARWLRQSGNSDPAVRASLDRYYRFVNEQLQRKDGWVFDVPGGDYKRLYNWPWVMHLHVQMAKLTGEKQPLKRFMDTVDSFYREGGVDYYPIGIPVTDGLRALKAAGMQEEHDRALALFSGHGVRMIERGTHYPPMEVNFEQSIVAPAAMLLMELHRATGDGKWLEAARPHLAMLDLFEGRQPDHHLNGISIRHWDGYWFGKSRMWGDTFPHYWSSLNAIVWQQMAKATGEARWQRRADKILLGNLSLFTPDGRGSAAFMYPTTVNGRPCYFADPYANDQDWALVHVLQLREE